MSPETFALGPAFESSAFARISKVGEVCEPASFDAHDLPARGSRPSTGFVDYPSGMPCCSA